MKVIKAKSAGFCWGVERAVNIAREFATGENKRRVITDGPLIHNRQMMEQLEDEGIREIGDYQSQSELAISDQERAEAVLVVRAHGISPQRREYLKGLGIEFKDATCPDVGIIAGKIRLHAKKGYSTVIFADPKHPEAIGLMGYTEGKGHVITCKEDIDKLPPLGDKVCLVSQSTMFTFEFEELAGHLKGYYPDLQVFDTICGATKERQNDVIWLMKQNVQAIVVIGGKHSANTVKLVALARAQNIPTYHIETANEVDAVEMSKYNLVGLTAGASTPDFIIEAVQKRLEVIEPVGVLA
jgi:(E)-4-hydroxy-3-methyl-but-2-enyl pyrophosphate reductase